MTTKPNRREFLSTTAKAAALTGLAATQLRAEDTQRKAGPNDMINLALIGCGGRGRTNMAEFMKLPAAQIVAVCDVDSNRLATARDKAGGDKVAAYGDFRKITDDRSIDAVIIATNDHWHVLPAIYACRAGKDVYLEKPVGTTIGEGRAAINVARKYDRIVQIGTQQRSWEHYRRAVEIIQSGRLGEICEVKCWDYDNRPGGFGLPPDGSPPPELDWDFWVGPSPKVAYNPNRPRYHYWFFDYGGGWQTDWGVHHYDIVHWAMDVHWPVSVTAMGGKYIYGKDNLDFPSTFSAICEYDPGPVAKKGFLMQYSYRDGCRREQRSHGKCFFGTQGSLFLDRSGYTITSEVKAGKKLIEEESFVGATANHQEVFLENVRSRKRPFADVEVGHHSSNVGHLMNIAWRTGQTIRWDGEKEEVIGNPPANRYLTKEYRAPWKLEV